MATVFKDIQAFAGEVLTLPDTIYQADGITPENISGWAVQFVVHAVGSAALVTLTTAGGGIVLTDPTAGVLTITFDTSILEPGNYQFRVERPGAGVDAVLTAGTLVLLAR